MAARDGQVTPQDLYELYWASAGASGTLIVPAASGEEAVATVLDRPSMYGLNANPIVGHPTRLTIQEATRLITEST